MDSLSTLRMKSNTHFKINFDGGQISSDGGLLLLKEFCHKLGADSLIKRLFKMEESSKLRQHKDPDNLLQMLYQIFCSYFEDDCADELTNESVMTAVWRRRHLPPNLHCPVSSIG